MKDVIVIFVHGEYGCGEVFGPFVHYLRNSGYIASNPTLPGHTGTPKEQEAALEKLSLEDYVRHIQKVVAKFRLQHPEAKLFLLGHSTGTSVIHELLQKDQGYAGAIYLAGTAHKNIFTILRATWRYRSIASKILSGKPHTAPFSVIQKEMMNTMSVSMSMHLYSRMSLGSGRVLRKVFFKRYAKIAETPILSIFGKEDRTIGTPRISPPAMIVPGDHISMIEHSYAPVLKFIEQTLRKRPPTKKPSA